MVLNKPSNEMIDKQAFSIVNKEIHFGLNSGFSLPLSFPSLDFICLQLTRISWTLCTIAAEVESAPLISCKYEAFLRNARSLQPMVGALLLEVLEGSVFNIFIRKWMLLGESIRSSWPWNSEFQKSQGFNKNSIGMCNVHHFNETYRQNHITVELYTPKILKFMISKTLGKK